MNARWLFNKICSTLYENRSNIEFVVGTGLVIAGTGVVISKAEDAVKVKHEMERQIKNIELTDEADGWENSHERTKACVKMAKSTAVGYVKVYGIGIGMEVAGFALQGVSKVTDRKEIASKAAALTFLASHFAAYRQNVIADQGIEKDEEYLLGKQEQIVNDNGEVEKKPLVIPDHSFLFDETNDDYEKQGTMNYDLLDNKERWINEELQRKGFLTNNYIRSYCKCPESISEAEGDWGFTAFDDNGNKNYISFGINNNTQRAKDFREGIEKSFLIILSGSEPNIHRKLYRLNKYHKDIKISN